MSTARHEPPSGDPKGDVGVTERPGKRFPHVGVTIESDYLPVSYRVERVLGEGGTAVACLCTRFAPDGQSPVVVKVIAPRMASRSGEVASTLVRKEAVALGRLNERVPPSPFVVRFLEAGTTRAEHLNRAVSVPWLALEYVHGGIQGTTLEQRVEHSVRETGFAFGIERAARLIEHVAKGLTEVHAVDVVHRDLNPNNVLCCGTGTGELFKLSDFGIARPHGMSATFTGMTVGTPGYLAPEQAVSGLEEVGFWSDIFSFGALVYYVLTGEAYFPANDVPGVLAAAKSAQRRRLFDAPCLTPELREYPPVCTAIDQAIARATAFEADVRPPTPIELASSVTRWLACPPESARRRARQELVGVMERARPSVSLREARWTVRHPPGDERLIVGAAWNASGHCLAATTQGMSYWDGSSWADAPEAGLPLTRSIRFVRRLDASTWLTGGKGTTLAEFSREGTKLLLQGRDPNVELMDAYGALDEVVVVLGRCEREWRLYGVVAGHWLKGLPISDVASLSSVARIDTTRWLTVGRDLDGMAYAAVHSPLDFEVRRIELPRVRALLCADGHPDRPQALAVGTGGLVVLADAGDIRVHVIEGEPDLTACAMDITGRPWVAGAGRLWTLEESGWVQAWSDPSWRVPVVSIMAELGFVVATTVDGAVVEFHTDR
jgi:serine/threonine protein kinase